MSRRSNSAHLDRCGAAGRPPHIATAPRSDVALIPERCGPLGGPVAAIARPGVVPPPFRVKKPLTFLSYAQPTISAALSRYRCCFARKSPICPRPAARHDVQGGQAHYRSEKTGDRLHGGRPVGGWRLSPGGGIARRAPQTVRVPECGRQKKSPIG